MPAALSPVSFFPLVEGACRPCSVCVLLALIYCGCADAATYRWVDAQGKVHYSDHPPAETAESGHIEMDAQGRVTKRVKALPTTPEGRKQLELETARQAAQEREAQEQRRRDSALLSTYRNIAELDKAKQRALELEQSLLVSLRTSRKQSVSVGEAQLLDNMIKQRLQNIEAIVARFEADKARYIELTGKR
jgi:hypothetical protein